jgi:ABC-type sugar transport system ATPase subunit
MNRHDNPILEMRNITKEFPGVKALNNVSFKVAKGEIHCLVGENGAGKSTLMKVLSGVYPHGTYTGDICTRRRTSSSFDGHRDSERPGSPSFIKSWRSCPDMTVYENIFLGMRSVKGFAGQIGTRPSSGASEMLVEGRADGQPGRPPVKRAGRRQAAVGRDRQGPEQGCEAADSR